MNQELSKEIISEWCADVASIPGPAMQAWSRMFNDIPDDDYNYCMEAIDQIAETMQNGHYRRNPNRQAFYSAYKTIKNVKERKSTKLQACSVCNQTGLLYMVIATNLSKHKQVPVRRQVAIPSPKADIVPTPCSCEKGVKLMSQTFIKPDSDKADPDRYYTKEQIERLAMNCGYSSRTEADAYRKKCEHYYHAWLEKYPNKAVDQSIGYKGEKQQQVAGFWTAPETRYEP